LDEPSPSWIWWIALLAAAAGYLFVASARVAFRLLGPVTIEALVDRIGADRTEFLRKSLRAPTALWFSLSLANSMALLAVTIVMLGRGIVVPDAPWGFRVRPTGELAHDVALFLLMLAVVATVEFLLPVLIARIDPTTFVERTLPVIRAIHVVMSPLSKLLEKWSGQEKEDQDDEETGDEEMQAYITVGTREGILEESEGELLRNVLLFGDTTVREVMTPRTDVVGIEATATVREVVELMARTRHSRIPVHEGHLDQIVGIAAMKDAVSALQDGRAEQPVTTLAGSPYIVPEGKRVTELLREMQARRQQIAIVADEYGGTAGLATIEDLIEELVGEIREEHEEGDDVQRAPDGAWIARGRASLHDLGEALGADLQADEEVATLGGLVMSLADRVPSPGEVLIHDGFRFRIVEADRRRVLLVRIEPVAAEGRPEHEEAS
jgi:CBS domain containing-hemolysin-like protein